VENIRSSVLVVLLAIVCGSCIAADSAAKEKIVTVKNLGSFFRQNETISVSCSGDVLVYDMKTGSVLLTQRLGDKLLFQTYLGPDEEKKFKIVPNTKGVKFDNPSAVTYCRFIPERSDDFGWENDKVVFRMYGPALEWETITCGIDAWGKYTPYPVIDRYIKDNNENGIPYHDGQPDGGDFYKVGNTLGCGGMAPFIEGKVCLSDHNFAEWKVIANGPIRSVFELKYKPWDAGGLGISETKIISIDLGSNLSRIECYYSCDKDVSFEAAAGIVLREVSDVIWAESNVIGYWIPADYKEKGNLGCGVVFDKDYKTRIQQADGHLLLTTTNSSVRPIVYYSGSCWDKNEEFNNFDKWKMYLKNFKMRLNNPISVSIAE
jgi:unsaturated rhamnogalacturonyl hydrolase